MTVMAWEKRARLKGAVRSFFTARDYLEIDTPVAVLCPGTEVHLGYFETTWRDHAGRPHPLWLRSSPELHMKQAVAAGAPRVFQMAPCFRNGGELADWHHPEFTMLEYYEAGIAFDAFVTLTLDLMSATREALGARLPWPANVQRLTVADALAEFAKVTLVDGDPDFAKKARAAGAHSPKPDDDFETAFFKVMMDVVEPALARMGAVVLQDYPASQAALATVEGSVAKRFEVYVQGIELCNGFKELLEPEANEVRIEAAREKRRALGHPVPPLDPDFTAALARGLPPCCGNALGLDRWLALLLGEKNLDSAIPFRKQAGYKGKSGGQHA